MVGLAVWIGLRFPVRRIWAALPRWQKVALIALALLAATGGAVVLINSLSIGGRGLDLRTWLYETAMQMFAQRPLTGNGLFTFGAGLSRLNSLPPLEPHSHAHNVILQVAAELGVVGLIALALTAWAALHALLRAIRRPVDPITVMGIAAFAGFATHQMFDLPAMMPTIALAALIALLLAVTPGEVRHPTATGAPNLATAADRGRRHRAGDRRGVERAQLSALRHHPDRRQQQ